MSIKGIPSERTPGLVARRVWVLLGLGVLFLASPTATRIPQEFATTPVPSGMGWPGFTELGFLIGAFLHLLLAAVLGTVIGYHPRRIRTADTLEEIEAPKVSIVCAVIGSLIGILVVRYGLVVGFVLFGIGGLIRFRSMMGSPRLTGQVIFVTLIGLTCGLDLPHVAVTGDRLRLRPHAPSGSPDGKCPYRRTIAGAEPWLKPIWASSRSGPRVDKPSSPLRTSAMSAQRNDPWSWRSDDMMRPTDPVWKKAVSVELLEKSGRNPGG
jgi:hypothetical protein